MADFRYFADIDGEAVALRNIRPLDNAEFAGLFPGIKGRRSDSFSRFVGYAVGGRMLPVMRSIERRANPSNHKCDARCESARSFKCECSCGGHNHGRKG